MGAGIDKNKYLTRHFNIKLPGLTHSFSKHVPLFYSNSKLLIPGKGARWLLRSFSKTGFRKLFYLG